MFGKGMSNEQFNTQLETLAKLIEASAKTVEDAARIVREAKIKKAKAPVEQKDAPTKGEPLNFTANDLAVPEIHVEK